MAGTALFAVIQILSPQPPKSNRQTQKRPRGAFCRLINPLEQRGCLAAKLHTHSIPCIRVALDTHLAEHLSEQSIRRDHLVTAGQQRFKSGNLLAVDRLKIRLRGDDQRRRLSERCSRR